MKRLPLKFHATIKMERLTIGLFNDSFPPTIDGVANTVLNYARIIQKKYGEAVVATPSYPGVADRYPFTVIRYPSVALGRKFKYRAGYPFNPFIIQALRKKQIDVIHTHSPFSSTVLARILRFYTGAPIILTYHTKFEFDLAKYVPFASVKNTIIRMILTNVAACDEVWAVSDGTGQNLKQLGFKGEYRVMQNGTDYTRGRVSPEEQAALRHRHALSTDVPTFLYVGRMMWYKGIRYTLDALRIVMERGQPFRMIFVGDGTDYQEIVEYAQEQGLADRCVFTGAVYDRQMLKAYYSVADLFILTSTYDNSPLVVREAASCDCPSLLITGSCSAEIIEDDVSGLLAPEDGPAIAERILAACAIPGHLQALGRMAGETVYMSWEQAIDRAYQRYLTVLHNHQYKSAQRRKDLALVRHFNRLWHRNAVLMRRNASRLKKTGQRIKGTFKQLYRRD